MTIDEGVPGIFNKIAAIRPPDMAPMYKAMRRLNPSLASIANVSGRNRETAIVADKPGMAPKIIPITVKHNMTSMKLG